MVTQIRRLQSEGLPIAHFDTLTGQPLELTTTFKNTIAEYLFPNTTFSLGTVYPKTTEEQLKSIPDKTLAFANGEKFYFADTQVRHQIFPKDSDGAAYGSIPFTDNRSLHELAEAKVLVIDDETGENNVGLETEAAKRLVADCRGKISPTVHEAIAGSENKNTPFQFRLGIRDDHNTSARIAKGTLAPVDLSFLGDYDMILPKSAFKGRKGEQNQEISAGEHTITLALGLKTHAYRGQQSLGPQILVNYPKSAEAAIPLVQERLAFLTQIASDVSALAADYLETTRSRYRFIAEDRLDEKILNDEESSEALLEELGDDYLEQETEIYDRAAELLNKERNYHLIKADLEGHRQLLEHPKVVNLLNKHLQTQYRELATGRALKFQAALLQPSWDLKEDEFCDPKLPEGVKAIVTRSPFINSNNFIFLTNRHIPEAMEMQGSVFLNPKTAAKDLQADFDGDRVAFERIPDSVVTNQDRFLITLAEEIQEKQLPQNRYADVVKPDKKSYEGSFEAIALSARENQVGIIANQVMKAIALEHETKMLPEPDKEAYIRDVATYFKGKDKLNLPQPLQPLRWALDELANLSLSDPIESNLTKIATFNHQLVGLLGNQLQIAVDGPKSAARPDPEALKIVRETLSKYRDIAWLKDYKDEAAYFDRSMDSNSYSPIDRLITTVNQQFEKYQLAPRPSHQFRPLFPDITYTEGHKELATELRSEHNRLNDLAHRLEDAMDEDAGVRLLLHSPKDNHLEVIDLANSNHPKTFDTEQMKIKVRFDERKGRYGVFAEVAGEMNEIGQPQYRRIGYLSKDSAATHKEIIDRLMDEKGWSPLGVLKTQLKPGITSEQVKTAFNQVREYDEQARAKISEPERVAVAAALWDLCHTRTDKVDERSFRKGSAVYQIFPDEINARLAQLQFRSLEISKLREPTNQHGDHIFESEMLPVEIQFVTDPNDSNHNQRVLEVEGKILGIFAQDSPQLPTGTTATASVTTVRGSGVAAVTREGQTLRIGVLKNYAYAQTDLQSIEAHLTFETIENKLNRTVLAARLDGLLLGEIKDVNTKNYLKEKGYIDSGQPLSATITRDAPSVAKIVVDPNTVVYPKVQRHDRALSTQERAPQLLPTLWSQSEGGLTLAVDNRNTDNLLEFFDRHSVPVQFASDAPVEGALGYAVVRFDSLSDPIYDKLLSKLGEPLSFRNYLAAINRKDRSSVTSGANTNTKVGSDAPREVVEIIEDILIKDELTPDTQKKFNRLDSQSLHWIEGAIDRNQKEPIKVPPTNKGEDWDVFCEVCLSDRFEDLVQATSSTIGSATRYQANLFLLESQAFRLEKTHPDLARSLAHITDEKKELLQQNNALHTPSRIAQKIEHYLAKKGIAFDQQALLVKNPPLSYEAIVESLQSLYVEPEAVARLEELNETSAQTTSVRENTVLTDRSSSPDFSALQNENSHVVPRTAIAINIASNSSDRLGAALTNPTETAYYYFQQSNGSMGCNQHYPVSYKENPPRPATQKDDPYYQAEKYWQDKPLYVPFVSAEDAYKFYAKDLQSLEEKEILLFEIIAAKLAQYPQLTLEIEKRGGTHWLETCSHTTKANNANWEGTGRNSRFIRALISGYEQVISQKATLFSKPKDPYLLIPYYDKESIERNRAKDRVMAIYATQFIGFSAQTLSNVTSSTRDYQTSWGRYGLANTGNYSSDDVIMVSGSGPWRGVTEGQIRVCFEDRYLPLLEQAIAAKAHFVVGDAAGCDQLVQAFLKEKGYELNSYGQGFKQTRSREQVQVRQSTTKTKTNDSISPFKPTPQQQEALEKLRAWFIQPVSPSLSENIFLLKGYAGTGKSYITSQWLSELGKKSLVYTAPTHKALGVGRAMLEQACSEKPNIRTLQSLLKVKFEFNEQRNQGEFNFKPLDIREIQKMPDLILVDEASMIDETYWSALKQLAEQGKKILLIGDDAQIRPVKGNGKSPIFSDPIVKNQAELTQVVRYTTEQGYLATALRTEQGSEKLPIVSSIDGSVQALPKSEWRDAIVSKFTSNEFQENPHYFQIYAYTNERVDRLNRAVRGKLWGTDAAEYVVGEAIVAKEPINDPLTGKKAMDNEQEAKIVNLYPPKVDENGISCWLADVQLSTIDTENTSKLVTVKLVTEGDREKLDQLLLSKEREYKAHPEPGMRAKLWEQFNEFKQEYGNIKYAYAATFHAAQGSTKEFVAIDEQNLNEHFDSRIRKCTNSTEQTELLTQRNELLYVAATRAKQGTFVFNQQAELAKQYNRQGDTVWYLPPQLQNQPEVNESLNNYPSQASIGSDVRLESDRGSLKSFEKPSIAHSIQQLTVLDAATISSVQTCLDSLKGRLTPDVSNYAASRQRFWLGIQWDLKEKSFKPSGVWNSQLWEFCQRVYPGSQMALITYSGDGKAGGIGLHRDDSYAAFEARTVSIESNPGASTLWEMRQMYPGMNYTKEQAMDAPVTQFKVESGSVLAFNCKNPHAAHPEEGRWSINIWKVSAKYEAAYQEFVDTHGLSGGAKDLSSGELMMGESLVINEAKRRSLHSPPIVNTIPWPEYGKKAELEKRAILIAQPAQALQSISSQELQSQRTTIIAPILMNLLNCKLATEYQGEKYTLIFDRNTQNLSCYRSQTLEKSKTNLDSLRECKASDSKPRSNDRSVIESQDFMNPKQLISQAQFRDGLWHPLPILLSDSNEPNLNKQDIEFFIQTLEPQLEKHQEQYRQVYLTYQSSFSDLDPTESDTAIALSMLEDEHSVNQVSLTINQSDTFKKLSPASAIDYRQQIVDDALQIQNTEKIQLTME